MKTFPEQSPWEIGAAKAPVEFEPENVAGMARSMPHTALNPLS